MNNLFKMFLEADDAPDANLSDEAAPSDDMGDLSGEDPPDLDDGGMGDMPEFDSMGDEGGGDDMYGDDGGDGGGGGEEGSGDESPENLDDKISATLNKALYQRFTKLMMDVRNQISLIRSNKDIIRSVSSESTGVLDSLIKLEENIHLYLTNTFVNENYSKNLLFFNKSLNYLKMLNDVFNQDVKKNIKS